MKRFKNYLVRQLNRLVDFLSRHKWILVVVLVLLVLCFVVDWSVHIYADVVFISDYLEDYGTSDEFWELFSVVSACNLVTLQLSFLWFLLFSVFYHLIMLLSGRVERKRKPKQ